MGWRHRVQSRLFSINLYCPYLCGYTVRDRPAEASARITEHMDAGCSMNVRVSQVALFEADCARIGFVFENGELVKTPWGNISD